MVNQDQPQLDIAPQVGTFLVDIHVPEVVAGKNVDLTELPRHMVIKDPALGAVLWALLSTANDEGMIETGSPVWVGREQ